MTRGRFLYMHFDGIAVRPFVGRDFVAGLGELLYLARKAGKDDSQDPLLFFGLGGELVSLLLYSSFVRYNRAMGQ